MKVVVVGAGLGGLSAAAHLVGAGHDVTVVERAANAGGRAGRWESQGYTFDTGPTVLTMRGILADTFAAAGASLEEHVDLRPIDPMYRATFPDLEPIYVRRGREAMTAEIRGKCGPADADRFGGFCDWLTDLYGLEGPNFIDRNWDSPFDLARPLAPALKLVRMGAFRRMASVSRSWFRDPRLQKLFSFQALYAGLSPFDALAVYCVITYMDSVEGVWWPAGGIHQVVTGLTEALKGRGVEFRFSTPVNEIVRDSRGRVSGVRIESAGVITADVVVANPDLPAVYSELLDGMRAPRVARRGAYSPSAALWLGGVRGRLPAGCAHHNIHFGVDWEGSFANLLDDGALQADPAILVSTPCVTDESVAPAGGQVIYALEPVPNLDGRVDWQQARSRVEHRLIDRLESLGYPAASPVTSKMIDPLDWQRMGMARGTPFSLAHRFSQSGPWRPSNIDKRVPGLVLVGSGTTPGVGVPMVLLSGRLAAQRVAEMSR